MQKASVIQYDWLVDFILNDNKILRYNDPRRFGAILWTENDPAEHRLLKLLGIERLNKHFTAQCLRQKATARSAPIKSFIMDSKVVVGIGNIYATEALFLAGINPVTPAKFLSDKQCDQLVKSIKKYYV